MRVSELLALSLVGLLAACRTPAPVVAPTEPETATLQLDQDDLRSRSASDQLIAKLATRRFSYFRVLAEAYEDRVCTAFADLAPRLPTTAVQGDAHLEQFVVTADGFGLEDFDHAGYGPAVIDLVRYAASIHVACVDMPWKCDPDAAIEKFMNAYREALLDEPVLEEPSIVQRLRSRAPSSRLDWLTWVNTLMMPLLPATEARARAGWSAFSALMRRVHPEWSESFTDVVRMGALRMGVGSALDHKLLVRIQGPTEDPGDDLVVEAREGRVQTTTGCVWRGNYSESLVLVFISMLGRRLPEVHGMSDALNQKRRFWLQSWDPGYVELSVRDIASQTELDELAVDAARQLAGPLWNRFPERLRRYEQYAQVSAFDDTRARALVLAKVLADETNAAWERFRAPAPVVPAI